jgi:hypothetical protein
MLVIALAGTGAAAVYGWNASSTAATGPATIRITAREISRVRVDVPPVGRRVGDTEIVRQNLFNRRVRSTPIGTSEYVCTFTTSRTRACTVTIFLPKGRLVVGGSIRYQELYELAVLGGTRLYDNARGTLTVRGIKLRPRQERVIFRLVG